MDAQKPTTDPVAHNALQRRMPTHITHLSHMGTQEERKTYMCQMVSKAPTLAHMLTQHLLVWQPALLGTTL